MELKNKIIEKFNRIKILPTGDIVLDVSYTAASVRQEIATEFIVVYDDNYEVYHGAKKTAIHRLEKMPLVLIEKYTTTRWNKRITIHYENGRAETLYNPTLEQLYEKLSKFNVKNETLKKLIDYLLI